MCWLQRFRDIVHYSRSIFLKGNVSRKWERSSSYWLTSHMATTVRYRWVWRQEPILNLGLMQVTGPQVLGQSSAAFLGAIAGSLIRSETARTQTSVQLPAMFFASHTHSTVCVLGQMWGAYENRAQELMKKRQAYHCEKFSEHKYIEHYVQSCEIHTYTHTYKWSLFIDERNFIEGDTVCHRCMTGSEKPRTGGQVCSSASLEYGPLG